jgi:hypothetical protein
MRTKNGTFGAVGARASRWLFRSGILVSLLLGGCDDDDGRIVLRNRTGRAITSVSIDPCGTQTPGPDKLGTPLANGESASFDVEFGCHRVTALTMDGFPGIWEVEIGRGARQVVLFAEPPFTRAQHPQQLAGVGRSGSSAEG